MQLSEVFEAVLALFSRVVECNFRSVYFISNSFSYKLCLCSYLTTVNDLKSLY